uniref:NocS n=1 Tax=Nostoc sp. CCAP 1453/38 TaxID=1570104 RepID=A0A186QIQ8_9NOSO|nr:NocS [Nostoc sp. CCAP 1453/38]
MSNNPISMQSVLSFDGIDDNLILPKGFPTINQAITIEFWARTENTLKQTTSIFNACNAIGNRLANVHLPWGGQIYWDAGDENGSFDRINKIVKVKEYNTWTHWAFVKDVTAGKMLIYRQGEIWHQGEEQKKSLAGIEKFIIGAFSDNSFYWKGCLTEFRIWNIARNPEEIQQNMNCRLVGNEAGLVGYYPLNGHSNDQTTNANHGIINGATWQEQEVPIQLNTNSNQILKNMQCVLMFDGKDDYVEIPYNQSLNPELFTVSCWVKVTGGEGRFRSVITSRDNYKGYIIYAGDNNKWQAWVGNGNAWEVINNDPPLVLNVWTHIASTFDGKQLKLYIDGTEVCSKNVVYALNNRCPVRIGTGSTEANPQYFYPGQIVEVSVWNKALTGAEIQAQMNQRLTGQEDGLVAYLPLNEGSGSIVSDKTDKGNNGIINGASWQEEEVPIQALISVQIENHTITGGNTPTKYDIADGATNFYLVDTNNPINDNGELTGWEIWAENTLPVQLMIYRKEADSWLVVGNSELQTPVVGLNQFSISAPIKVNKGDFVGIYHPQAGCVSFFKEQSAAWAIGNLSGTVLFTGSGASSTAFSNSTNRTYSLIVKGNTQVGTEPSMPENEQPSESEKTSESVVNSENQQPSESEQSSENQQDKARKAAQIPQTTLKFRKGFSFDEAILMATFSQYAFDFFEYDDDNIDDLDLREIYKSIYKNQGWELVHTVRNDKTNIRGLILKNTQSADAHKYVISLRGTSFGYTDSVVNLNNIISDLDWKLVDYGPLSIQFAKVVQGINVAFESVADEIQYFFKALRGEIKPSDFRRLHQLDPIRKFACINALAGAGGIRLGAEFDQKAQDLIEKVIADGEVDDDEELEEILEFLEQQLLSGLSPFTESIQVWVTGFSLGAALSQVVGLALRRWFGAADAGGLLIKVYAIASPKIGNQQFIDFYNQQIGEELSYRIENVLDVVPTYPYDPPFLISAIAPEGLKLGNLFLGKYANGGEPIAVMGVGGQSASFTIPGLFSIPFTIPFPHSPETYLDLLKEQKQFWEQLTRPVKDLVSPFLLELLREEQRRTVNPK